MHYEVIQQPNDWSVHCDGVEVARFVAQASALNEVAQRLGHARDSSPSASLTVRYEAPARARD